MPFEPTGDIEQPRGVGTATIATACLGGVVLAVVIGALLYAFVRVVSG
jgi:hypothetical protein